MSINEQDIDISLMGVERSGGVLPSFLVDATIQDDTTAYPVQAATLTVALLNQTVFNLGFAPPANAIKAAVVNRKTYFEPDFTVVNQTLTWNLGILPIGTVVTFEAAGNEQAHRYLQVLPINVNGQQQFELVTVPKGYEVELYLNGFFYDRSSELFDLQRNMLNWRTASLKTTDKLVAVYARTAEGSLLFQYDNLKVNPAASTTFTTSLDVRTPASSRLYFRGLRYINVTDYTTTLDALTVVTPLSANHGEVLTFVQATDPTYFRKVNDSGLVAQQVFVSTAYQAVDTSTTLPIDNPSVKSILSVNGLTYAEGTGYDRSSSHLDWDNAMALGVGDAFALLGFFEQESADSVQFANFTGVTGYPTFDLGVKAADIRKALVFVAADANFGGELYMGHLYLQFPTNHQVTWAGTFPLKATDRITIVFITNPALAASLVLESHQITSGESGQPFAHMLRQSPKEPSSVLMALNGARVMQPYEFIINDNVAMYFNSAIPVKTLDVVTYLYR